MKLTNAIYRVKCMGRALAEPRLRNRFVWDIEVYGEKPKEGDEPLLQANVKGDHTTRVVRIALILAALSCALSLLSTLCRLFRK